MRHTSNIHSTLDKMQTSMPGVKREDIPNIHMAQCQVKLCISLGLVVGLFICLVGVSSSPFDDSSGISLWTPLQQTHNLASNDSGAGNPTYEPPVNDQAPQLNESEGMQYNLTIGESIGFSDGVAVMVSFTPFELSLGRMTDALINALEFLTHAPTLIQILLATILPVTLTIGGSVTPVPSLPYNWEKLNRNLPGKIDRSKLSVLLTVIALLFFILGLSENLEIAFGDWGLVLLFGGGFLAIAMLMYVLVLMARIKL